MESDKAGFATFPTPLVNPFGFVSMGAGILLAANLFRGSLSLNPFKGASTGTTLNFIDGGMMQTILPFDPSCELSCQSGFGPTDSGL
jgi:hypothetical protein